jgi:hypothetical protein
VLAEARQPRVAVAAYRHRWPTGRFIQVYWSSSGSAAKACQPGAASAVPAAAALLIGGPIDPIEMTLRARVVIVIVVTVPSRRSALLRRATASRPIGVTIPERNRLIDPVFVGERHCLGRLQPEPTEEHGKCER